MSHVVRIHPRSHRCLRSIGQIDEGSHVGQTAWGRHRRLASAIQQVAAAHPKTGYLTDTEEEIRGIASRLLALEAPAARLLDIGCGAMDKTAVFSILGYDCCAVDDFQDPWHLSGGNLSALEEFAATMRIDLRTQVADEALPWPAGSFDVVTILAVIEHLHESPRELLNLAGHYLRPGGTIVVTMPNAVNLRKRLSVVRGRTNYPAADAFFENVGAWRGHVREYTLEETELILGLAGFEVFLAEQFHGLVKRRLRSRVARATYRAACVGNTGLKDSIFVAARKPHEWSRRAADPEAARRAISDSVPRAIE